MLTFSIITPFYRGNQYIGNIFSMVESNRKSLLLNGIDSDVELIVVNDSPEINVEVPDNVLLSYKICVQAKNMGIHQARISGLQESKGEYILFLDQDDEIADDYLAKQYINIKNEDMSICMAFLESSDGTKIDYYGSKLQKKILHKQTYLKSHNQIISPGQCLIKRTAIPGEWLENVMYSNGSDDLFLWLLMFEQGKTFVINKQILYTHKFTGKNLSAEGSAMAHSSLEFVNYLKEIPYVPQKDSNTLMRSRMFDLEFEKAVGAKKIQLLIRNFDIVLHRVIWKMKCI